MRQIIDCHKKPLSAAETHRSFRENSCRKNAMTRQKYEKYSKSKNDLKRSLRVTYQDFWAI